jgi:hypothetical protein
MRCIAKNVFRNAQPQVSVFQTRGKTGSNPGATREPKKGYVLFLIIRAETTREQVGSARDFEKLDRAEIMRQSWKKRLQKEICHGSPQARHVPNM